MMSYLGENRITVDFIPNITPKNNYNVMQNAVTFYSNTIIDLSAFDVFDSSSLEHSFYASKFDGYTQMTLSQESAYAGLYSFSVSQDPISNKIVYNIYSFDQCLALVGGYAGIITFMLAIVMNGYQEFAYERSLVR